MKQMKLLAAPVLAVVVLTGCNTVAGVGQDLQAAGAAISETSDEVREAIVSPNGNTQTASACDPGGDELAGRSTRPNCR